MDIKMEQTTGPLLTDEQFFTQKVDCTLPGLQTLPQLAQNGDFAACRKQFAAYIRATLQPETYFAVYDRYEGEYRADWRDPQNAEKALQHFISGYQLTDPVDWYSNYTPDQYVEWTWGLNRHYPWPALAQAYRTTGDEKYAACFARYFESWVRQAVIPPYCSGYQTKCHRTIEIGIRLAQTWQYPLHAFLHSPSFTDDLLVDWYKSVWEQADRLYNCFTSHNWLIMEMAGLITVAMLYKPLKDSARWFTLALEKLEHESQTQFYPDGFQYELTTNYHFVVIMNYMLIMDLALEYGVSLPQTMRTRLEQALEVYIKLMRPDTLSPDINDGRTEPVEFFLAPYAHHFPHNAAIIWAATRRKEGAPPPYTSVALPDSGFAVLRTGWEKQDFWAFFDAAHYGCAHQHEDKLNVLLYAGGRLTVAEACRYNYDQSQMRKYSLASQSHNTVLVNGKSQARSRTFDQQKVDVTEKSTLQFYTCPAYDWAGGIYDEGYANEADETLYTGAVHRRSLLLLKQPGHGLAPFLLVIDRLHSDDENLYEVVWHLDTKDGGVTTRGMDVKADDLQLLFSRDVEQGCWMEVAYGAQDPLQGWVSRKGPVQYLPLTDAVPVPTVRYFVKGRCRRVITLFYPCGEKACPITGICGGNDPADTDITLRLADGTTLQLDEAQYAR